MTTHTHKNKNQKQINVIFICWQDQQLLHGCNLKKYLFIPSSFPYFIELYRKASLKYVLYFDGKLEFPKAERKMSAEMWPLSEGVRRGGLAKGEWANKSPFYFPVWSLSHRWLCSGPLKTHFVSTGPLSALPSFYRCAPFRYFSSSLLALTFHSVSSGLCCAPLPPLHSVPCSQSSQGLTFRDNWVVAVIDCNCRVWQWHIHLMADSSAPSDAPIINNPLSLGVPHCCEMNRSISTTHWASRYDQHLFLHLKSPQRR